MNSNRVKEIKKEDKKAFKSFIIIMIISGIAGGILGGMSVYFKDNLSENLTDFIMNILEAITPFASVVLSLLVIITFIDLDHYIIPDELIIFGSLGAVIFNILGQGISIKDSLLGGLICGGGMLVLIYLIELIIKKEVMGGGDIKLFGMVGLFLGIKLGLLTILLSVYVGAIYGVATIIYSKIKKKEFNSMIPYGPFISVGALISILYGTNIINWYIGLF